MSEQSASTVRSQLSDLDIHEAVSNALNRLTIVRESQAPIEATVENGVVTLSGSVSTETMRRIIQYNVSRIPGVMQIVDQLHTDSQLQVAVAQTLANNPALGEWQLGISVTAYHGIVSLSGRVQNQNERMAALVAAKEVPGVRAVVDKLTVDG